MLSLRPLTITRFLPFEFFLAFRPLSRLPRCRARAPSTPSSRLIPHVHLRLLVPPPLRAILLGRADAARAHLARSAPYWRAARHTYKITTVRSPVRAFAFVHPSGSVLRSLGALRRSPLSTNVHDLPANTAVAGGADTLSRCRFSALAAFPTSACTGGSVAGPARR
ncbi:hypothetical protein DFH09DRAFT_1319238 [Mycena vulgaris]|nr:hypothetical protein DFH09DRAFT_1319238 [Mycena vulgaris]